MPKYKVKSLLRHDGKDYAPGKAVELTEEQAEQLAASGTIEPKADKDEPKNDGNKDKK